MASSPRYAFPSPRSHLFTSYPSGFLSPPFFVCLDLFSIPLLLPLRSRVFTSPCSVAISRLLSLHFRFFSPRWFSFFPFLCFYLPSSLSPVALLVPPSHRLETSCKVLAPDYLLYVYLLPNSYKAIARHILHCTHRSAKAYQRRGWSQLTFAPGLRSLKPASLNSLASWFPAFHPDPPLPIFSVDSSYL